MARTPQTDALEPVELIADTSTAAIVQPTATATDALDQWVRDHVHGTKVSQDTPTYNTLMAHISEIRAILAR